MFFQVPPHAKPVDAPLKEKLLSMDPLGTTVFMSSMICFLLALQWGGVSKSWGHSDVIGTLVGFALLLILFIVIEWRLQDRALLVPRLLKTKTIALITSFQFFSSGAFTLLMYFLPLYFQVVSGVSAAQSGVRNVPFILGISLFTIFAGVLITVTGHYIPLLLVGGILATVGNGMIYTLGVNSPSSEWIGYQVITGVGVGMSIQVPIIVGQAVVEPTDLSSITAIVMFFQTLGGAVFIQMGQSLFSNKLVKVIPDNVPNVNPALIVGTGATELRDVFDKELIPGIIRSFLAGLKDAYILAVALAALATVISFLIIVFDRRNLKGKVIGGGAA
jgi:hypothetical protein